MYCHGMFQLFQMSSHVRIIYETGVARKQKPLCPVPCCRGTGREIVQHSVRFVPCGRSVPVVGLLTGSETGKLRVESAQYVCSRVATCQSYSQMYSGNAVAPCRGEGERATGSLFKAGLQKVEQQHSQGKPRTRRAQAAFARCQSHGDGTHPAHAPGKDDELFEDAGEVAVILFPCVTKGVEPPPPTRRRAPPAAG